MIFSDAMRNEKVNELNWQHEAACTIVSKNYLPAARVLSKSIRRHHQNLPVFVLLVDRIDGFFNPEDEPFTLLEVESLHNIPNQRHLFFKYDILELNTAVKPYFFETIFCEYGVKKLLYFDPDILVMQRLDELFALLDAYSLLMTPHILEPYQDRDRPTEIDILRAGIYNLGFLGLKKSEGNDRFLKWWQDRLYYYCSMDPDRGIHVDQKWMDFAPIFFEDIHILRDPSYNVAYWNLHERGVQVQDGIASVNGRPIRFFHFSGYNPDRIEEISKHQNRFNLYKLPNLRPLFELYRNLILASGFNIAQNWPYAFETFENGELIEKWVRKWYCERVGALDYGDPFSTKDTFTFYQSVVKAEEDTKRRKRLYLRRLSPPQEEGSTSSSSGSAVQPELQTGPLSKPVTSLVDTDTSNEKFGVNISGYITGDFGVGEAARCLIRAVQAGNIPHVLRNIDVPWHNCSNQSFKDFQEEAAYPINIVCVNADMVPVFHKEAGQGFLTGRRNIGAWFWELASFPEKWFPSFSYFHEIWVASSFCAEALAKVSPIPIVKITYPIVLDVEKIHPNRQFFGLDEQTTVFLFTFDLHSVFERKNPLAIVDAFKRAFRKDDDVVLVLKTINSDRYPEQMNQLNEAMSGHRIRILDGHISSQDMLSLLASCDCYVSLHRAEGLGLSMAKCMLMGKPVIATCYSGNLDFMNLNNSLLIKYKLVELEKDYGPYTKGNEWAEPDVAHAVELMRRLYEDKDLRIRIGKRASKDIQTRMNPQVAFETIRPRLFRVGDWPHPQGGA